MKQKLLNKLWLRVGMIGAIMTTALSTTVWAETVRFATRYSSGEYSLETVGNLPEGASASFAGTYANATQMTGGNSQTLTLSGFEGYKITNITLSMKSNKSSGAGTLSYSTDGGTNFTYIIGSSSAGVNFNDSRWYNAWSTDFVDISKDVDIIATSSDLVIKVAATTNSLHCRSYIITYTTSSGSSAVPTTTTIDATGITNTDVYVGTAAGSLAATVSANGTAIEGATVTWSGNNDDVATIDASTGAVTLVSAGTVKFTAAYAGVEDEYEPSTATYEMTVTSSAPYEQPTTVEINMNYEWLGSDNGSNLQASALPVVKTNDNVTTTITDGTSTHPRGDADYIRVYKGSTITFAAPDGYIITEIEFTTGGSNTWNAPTPNIGTLSRKTWTGEAESVVFTLEGTCFISKVTVILETNTPKVLSSIALSGNYPTTFYVGDTFSHEGMIVTATYESGKTADVTANATFSTPDMTTLGTKEVTVSYTEEEITKTATYNITVNALPTLTSITLSGTYPTEFEQGDVFSSEGIVVTANYDDNTTSDVTANATFSGYDMATLGGQTVTVSYEDKTATYAITVVEKKGTEENPYTVAQAIANTPSSDFVYIRGIVSSFFKSDIISDGDNYRYYISDDGTTTSQLLVYKGKGLNQVTFSSADDLKVGDNVVIYGKLTTYSNAPEVASGNYIVSLERPDTPVETYTLTIANPENVTITATYGEGEDAPVLQNGENGEVEEGTEVMIALTIASGYVLESLTIAGVGEGQTITPVPVPNAEGVYTFNMPAYNVTVSATVSEIATGSNTYELVTDASSLVAGDVIIIAYNTETIHKAMGAQNDNNRAAVDVAQSGTQIIAGNTVQQITLEGDADGWYFNVGSGYLYAASSSKNWLRTQTDKNDNAKVTIAISSDNTATITFQGPYTHNLLKYNNNDGLFSCYESGQKAVQIYKYVEATEEPISVTFNASGYATFASSRPIDFSGAEAEGYTAWAITSANKTTGVINFSQITGAVAAGTGVLLMGEAGETVYPVVTTSGEDISSTNLLVGITEATPVEANQYYGLKGNTFKKVNAGTVPAGKALLPVDVVGEVKTFTFNFEDDATDIEDLNANDNFNEGAIYNLAGQRLQKMQKGINIVNGKKIAIK